MVFALSALARSVHTSPIFRKDRQGSNQNAVSGNFVGVDASGLLSLGNSLIGIVVSGGAQSNIIGTNGKGSAGAAKRNIISGNLEGVVISDMETTRNVVAGNYIGTNAPWWPMAMQC